MSLYEQLSKSIKLGKERKQELIRAALEGGEFFQEFNDERMKLAFSLFSTDMKKALYEILFFLHVNDQKYQNIEFESTFIKKQGGKNQEVTEVVNADLFVNGCPSGVVGMEGLSPIFKDDFNQFLEEEFQAQIQPSQGFAPFYSVASLGSIGTVGHKQTASDLDLQIQYETSDFLVEPSELTDEKLFAFAKQIIQFFARRYGSAKRYKQADLKNSKIKAEMMSVGRREFRKRFKHLFTFLVAEKHQEILHQCHDLSFAKGMVHEIIDMVKFYTKHCLRAERTRTEDLLQEKIKRIQSYIQAKYPAAEVYLFAYSNDDYRAGKHGTTLESKEASGSAYELILNYEVLMPGIQFTPMIPIHFLMPDSVNAVKPVYERMVDYIRYQFTHIFAQERPYMVDLGSTPPLKQDYMTAHSGAIYWESFKASSGNLPKAMLNLLRIEMLFDTRFNTSIIELIKSPAKLDKYIGDTLDAEILPQDEFDAEEDFFENYGIPANMAADAETIGEVELKGGLTILEAVKIEQDFPFLKIDPWWLRYKALKVGFGPMNKTVKNVAERDRISRIIDLGFALHVKISDVFRITKPKTLREEVLHRLLVRAFPGQQREQLFNIFAGEVKTVNLFERDLKSLFKSSMARVLDMVETVGGRDQSNQDEFRIWYHFYQKNFEPKKNVVRKDILSHLKTARGRLQIGFLEKQRVWFFKSLQKGVKIIGNDLAHLPDEVDLFEHRSILHGIAHCIMNGYYGIYNRGTLLESRTSVELSVAHMKLGKESSDKYCYVTPDMVVRLINGIDSSFPAQDDDYRDCIYKETLVEDIFICLNILEFGSLSILYRNNLKVWFVDTFEHPELEAQADEFHSRPDELLSHKLLMGRLQQFFDSQKFSFNEETIKHVTFWVNPNSLVSPGSRPQKQEEQLSKQFKKFALKALQVPLVVQEEASTEGEASGEATENAAEE